MANEVDISNNALLLIGAGQITGGTTLAAATSTNRETRIARALYGQTRDWLLSAAIWHFAKKKVMLDSDGLPDNTEEWSNEYKLPTDFIKLVRFYPRFYDYSIYESENARQMLYANDDGPIELDYISRIDESNWPTWYQNLFEFFWAAKLALPVTRKPVLSREMLGQFDRIYDVTVVTNAEQVPTESFGNEPFIEFR